MITKKSYDASQHKIILYLMLFLLHEDDTLVKDFLISVNLFVFVNHSLSLLFVLRLTNIEQNNSTSLLFFVLLLNLCCSNRSYTLYNARNVFCLIGLNNKEILFFWFHILSYRHISFNKYILLLNLYKPIF